MITLGISKKYFENRDTVKLFCEFKTIFNLSNNITVYNTICGHRLMDLENKLF